LRSRKLNQSSIRLQEKENFFLTPFERNLEVWRQLWRVLERSHLVVQIVDARNPLRFRCEDLEHYVKDVEGPEGERGTGKGKRRSLLLINKADLLTAQQRYVSHIFPNIIELIGDSIQWADYFDQQQIEYAFFSAANATAIQLARREAAEAQSQRPESDAQETEEDLAPGDAKHVEESDDEEAWSSEDNTESEGGYYSVEEEDPSEQDPRAKVLSVVELEDLFQRVAPPLAGKHPAISMPAESDKI
jgi:large subunit GTPase 1